MTSIEHRQLKGITIKNIIVTIFSTASIVASVMATYFELKGDVHEIRSNQESQNRINDIRLKVLENEVTVLQHNVEQLNRSIRQEK
ncbi:hypothetical protein [Mucilaginibacter phyllosphaerae]|uniref:Cell division protein FtsL n=1 Tax=Mucilaginibacter phyllosphaerae TaxID=1812349 RepID=A0A4Y8AJM3_9SPHI|nr:hypothetical protein [Mucilaginibacter phyllosphaerae]MBB3967719.1 cell division protein FtsL [Mucilaginibacter phyllosphaerae]TEW69228.1 hypothetical protein E2R65_03405 [Mucilaginibacter phyllosphaerae]GGH03779.1 hypothetical protein GCM10007352_06600 [Mucilaginibacter phyllosphaerae]